MDMHWMATKHLRHLKIDRSTLVKVSQHHTDYGGKQHTRFTAERLKIVRERVLQKRDDWESSMIAEVGRRK